MLALAPTTGERCHTGKGGEMTGHGSAVIRPDGRNMRLASFIQRHRRAADLTQEELAEKSELSVRAIGNLERGQVTRPRRQTLHRLAVGLGLDAGAREALVALRHGAQAHQASASQRSDSPRPVPVPQHLRAVLRELTRRAGADAVLVVASDRPGTAMTHSDPAVKFSAMSLTFVFV